MSRVDPDASPRLTPAQPAGVCAIHVDGRGIHLRHTAVDGDGVLDSEPAGSRVGRPLAARLDYYERTVSREESLEPSG